MEQEKTKRKYTKKEKSQADPSETVVSGVILPSDMQIENEKSTLPKEKTPLTNEERLEMGRIARSFEDPERAPYLFGLIDRLIDEHKRLILVLPADRTEDIRKAKIRLEAYDDLKKTVISDIRFLQRAEMKQPGA